MTSEVATSATARSGAHPPPACLSLRLEHDGHAVRFSYRTTSGDRGEVYVGYGFHVDPAFLPGIGLVVAVYLGQLVLAERLEVDFPLGAEMVQCVLPLAAMLYDIRRWKDDQAFGPPPAIDGCAGSRRPVRSVREDADGALVLWSGGKDSSLSATLLAENGYRTRALHITANAGVDNHEAQAVRRLARRLDLSPVTVRYAHPQFLELSSRYAVNWNRPPYCNTVPFGRDLLLAALAAPVLHSLGLRYLSLGHDHECRNAYVELDGCRVPRNDVESVQGAVAMERYLAAHVLGGTRMLPPVSGLSELRILQEMLVRHGDVMGDTAFCFWGGNCGRCAKCLRYYLAQRLFGVEVLAFRTNPVGDAGAPEMEDILDLDRSGVLFQEQVLLCAGRLVERGDIRPEEARLREFARTIYPLIADRLDGWEKRLLATGTDPQLPDDWRYPSAPATEARRV